MSNIDELIDRLRNNNFLNHFYKYTYNNSRQRCKLRRWKEER